MAGKTKVKTKARKKPAKGRTAVREKVAPIPTPAEELDAGDKELKQDYESLREKSSVLEGRYSDLEETHHELRQEHAELKQRARVIDERYSDLVERTDEGSSPSIVQISTVELQAMRAELERLRRERDERGQGRRMTCPNCGARLPQSSPRA
jgi:predicted nuclease with TOPRIM domain